MANDQKTPKPPTTDTAAFTLDDDSSGMPSVTKLLNRKSLGSVAHRTPSPPPPPQSLAEATPVPSEIQTSDSPPAIEISSTPEVASHIAIDIPSKPSTPAAASSPGEISIETDTSESFQIETSAPAVSQASTFSTPSPVVESSEIEFSGAPSLEISTPAPETLSADIPSTELSETPSPLEVPPPEPDQPLKVQPAARKSHPAEKQLIVWNESLLKSGADPLGKGIIMLMEKGATSALFLAITAPPAGSPTPHFVATAAVSPHDKIVLWTGLKWDPTVVPQLWNYFVRAGNAELSPPGAHTNQASNRNVVRSAFGLSKDEWLLLVRAGSAQACRGVIAFISNDSLLPKLSAANPFLSADLTTE